MTRTRSIAVERRGLSVFAFARELNRRSPALAMAAGVFALLAILFAVAWAADERIVLGINRWIKPFKFCISIAIYLATVGWFVPQAGFGPKALKFVTWAPIVSMVFEIVGIGGQAIRGTTSHFNGGSLFDGMVFSMMGVFIVVNTVAAGMLVWAYWVRTPALPRPYLTAVRLGLLISFLGMNEAWVMIARNAHTVGLADGGPGLPLVNWSTVGGDLRVAHFIGMHAMQALPLFAWWLSRRRGMRDAAAVQLVRASAVLYGVVAAALLALALSGRPLLRA